MKAESKIKCIDAIVDLCLECYSNDVEVMHGMMAAISAIVNIEEDDDEDNT